LRLGGDCAADLAVVRAQPVVSGPVVSDATVSRLVAALAADIDMALPAIRAAHAAKRPHPGAQLHLTDLDGWRITCFATNTRGPCWTLPALEDRAMFTSVEA